MMYRRNRRTMELYKKAGAEMRLFKTMGAQLAVDIAPLLCAADRGRLDRIFDILSDVCRKADAAMFADHPGLDEAYTKVFYGTTDMEPRDDLEQELLALAREAADGLFADGVKSDD